MASNYQPNIPTGSVPLSIDYVNLQNNFGQLDTSFNVNHFLFSDQTANNGKHSIVEFVNQTTPVGLPTGEFTLYSQQVGSPLISQLFFQQDNVGTQYQLTGPYPPISAISGQSFLPGGILVQWGTVVINAFGTVTFSTTTGNIRYPNALWQVFLTLDVGNSANLCQYGVSNFGPDGFNIYTSVALNRTLHYFCIGN